MFLLALIAVLELRVDALLVEDGGGRRFRAGSRHVEQDGQKKSLSKASAMVRAPLGDLFIVVNTLASSHLGIKSSKYVDLRWRLFAGSGVCR